MKISDFIITRKISEGCNSTVYVATHIATGIELILKKCMVHKYTERVLVETEIEIHKSLKHPRIISFYEYFHDPDDNRIIYIALEYARGGDLFQMMVNKMPESDFIEKVLKPIVKAVYYIHSHDIVHCDIKMENIFLMQEKDGAKLGDFGFATYETTPRSRRMGTREYMAPEILLCDSETSLEARRDNINLYGKPVDCWAIGVLLYEGIFGHTPWKYQDGETFNQFLLKIINNPIDIVELVKKGASYEAAQFISGCLKIHPKERMTCKDMLKNPWFYSQKQTDIKSHSYRGGVQSRKLVEVGRFNSERKMNRLPTQVERPPSPPRTKSRWISCLFNT